MSGQRFTLAFCNRPGPHAYPLCAVIARMPSAIGGDLVPSPSLSPIIAYRLAWTKYATRSATIITAGLMGARTRSGMIDASTMRNPSMPCTSPY